MTVAELSGLFNYKEQISLNSRKSGLITYVLSYAVIITMELFENRC